MDTTVADIREKDVPKHIAIIMDGNGRWAKKKGMQRIFGHRNALESIRESLEAAKDIGCQALTLYAFSTENWNRPKLEVEGLMTLMLKSLKKELPEFHRKNVKVTGIGNLDGLPKNVKSMLDEVVVSTQNNSDIVLNLALNYGGREELRQCVQQLAKKSMDGSLMIDELTDQDIQDHLYTSHLPDVDLMIRTSGEQRISNFLLWQLAYAEFYFTNVFWPDFRRKDFFDAIYAYQKRERRFGQTGEQIQNKH